MNLRPRSSSRCRCFTGRAAGSARRGRRLRGTDGWTADSTPDRGSFSDVERQPRTGREEWTQLHSWNGSTFTSWLRRRTKKCVAWRPTPHGSAPHVARTVGQRGAVRKRTRRMMLPNSEEVKPSPVPGDSPPEDRQAPQTGRDNDAILTQLAHELGDPLGCMRSALEVLQMAQGRSFNAGLGLRGVRSANPSHEPPDRGTAGVVRNQPRQGPSPEATGGPC